MILQIFWNLFGPIWSSKSKDIKEIRKTKKEKAKRKKKRKPDRPGQMGQYRAPGPDQAGPAARARPPPLTGGAHLSAASSPEGKPPRPPRRLPFSPPRRLCRNLLVPTFPKCPARVSIKLRHSPLLSPSCLPARCPIPRQSSLPAATRLCRRR